MPLAGYIVGGIIEKEVVPFFSFSENESTTNAQKISEDKARTLEKEGWEEVQEFVDAINKISPVTEWPIKVGEPERVGDLLKFPITISNSLTTRLDATVSVSTNYDKYDYFEKYSEFPNYIESGIIILPGSIKSQTLDAYIPLSANSKIAIFDFLIRSSGNIYTPKYVWQFNES